MGITQFAKENAMKSKKRSYTVMGNRLLSPRLPPIGFHLLVLLFRPRGGNIVPFEKHCFYRYKFHSLDEGRQSYIIQPFFYDEYFVIDQGWTKFSHERPHLKKF